MNVDLVLWVGLGISLALMAIGIPIAFAMMLVGVVGLLLILGFTPAFNLVGASVYTTLHNYTYSTVPLFILMGYFSFYAGIVDDLFLMARHWIGHFKGGLALATMLTCGGFAAVSASSAAATAVIGKVALPQLLKYGYHKFLAAGCCAAGPAVDIMIPPSIFLVVYAIITNQSIASVLLAGFLPGLLTVAIWCLGLFAMVSWRPSLATPLPKSTWRERFTGIPHAWGLLALVVLVLGGMYIGIFTATEAGGIGALGALVLAFIRRTANKKMIKEALLEAGSSTVMLFIIFVGIDIFSLFLTYTQMPMKIADWIISLEVSPAVIFLGICILYLFLGMLMPATSMVMLTMPIIYPAVVALGWNPIWFGIVVCMLAEIGFITPPYASNVFILKSVAPPEISVTDIYKGVGIFIAMNLIVVIIISLFPQIALFLPETMLKG